MHVITAQDIDIDGFAGLRERHYVMDSRVFGDHRKAESAEGLGAFVYLADAHFLRLGSTGRHAHRDIDIVTLVMNGRLLHRGTLGDESVFDAGSVLVQRAGRQGFEHNEMNPDETPNRIIQIWMKPDQVQDVACHEVRQWPSKGSACVYRSSEGNAATLLEVILLSVGESLRFGRDSGLYLVSGTARIGKDGDVLVPEQSYISGNSMTASVETLFAQTLFAQTECRLLHIYTLS